MTGTILFLLYNLLAPFIALLYFVFFAFSPRRGLLKNLLSELGERLCLFPENLPQGAVWIHAASVGEVKAVGKLAALLKEKYPAVPLLMTSSTWTGRTESLKLTPHARLLPLDFYPLMKSFVNRAKPKILLVAETELWPNMLVCAAEAGVRTCVINGRISPKTFALYRLLSPLAARIFSGVEKILAQSATDAAGYAALLRDASKVAVTGNMKYDVLDGPPAGMEEIKAILVKISWTGQAIWTAASTHPGEEEAVIDAYLELRAANPGLKLLIAPRHPERAGETRALLEAKNISFMLWSDRETSECPSPSAGAGRDGSSPDCLLMDKMGWLTGFYSLSAAVFVGGTLADIGGHNLLEPASVSKPVLFGPHVRNTREAADALLKARGGFMVENREELRARMAILLKDTRLLHTAGANARKALENLQGATAKTAAVIEEALPAKNP